MILAITNQKGGVGKTTTAVTLASGLARQGRRTMLVDLDSQGNVCDALGLKKGSGFYRLLVARMEWQEVVVPAGAKREGLDVIPGDKHTVEAKQYMSSMNFRERAIQNALAPAVKDYEYIVLDLAPSVDVLHIAALVAADAFLVPTRLDHLAVVGVNDALTTLAALKAGGIDPPAFLGVLPTFWDRTTKESEYQFAHLARTFGKKLWPPIPTDTKVREAPAHGNTLWEYAPDCRAVQGVVINHQQVGGYQQVLERLLKSTGQGGAGPERKA
jgi:chromosome partitioning protein